MDIEYLLLLQKIRVFFGDSFTTFIANFSNSGYSIFFQVIFFLFWSYNKNDGKKIIMALAIANGILDFVKLIACIYRPWIIDPRVMPSEESIRTAGGYSFPSGHSAKAASFCGMFSWLFRHVRWLAVLSIIYAVLIMFSRNLLGVHTPQDVLTGCLIGLFGIWTAWKLLEWAENGKNRDWIILAGVLVYGITVLIIISVKSYPIDYDEAGKLLVDPAVMKNNCWKAMGFLIGTAAGLTMEKRFLNFSVPDSWTVRIARFVPGLLLYNLGISWGVKLSRQVMGEHWGRFTGFFLVYFFLLFLYPLIFTAIEKHFSGGRQETTS